MGFLDSTGLTKLWGKIKDKFVTKESVGTAAAKNYTTSVTSGSTDLVTSGAVWTAIDNLPEPMVFKGTLGTSGTITALPTVATSNQGHTYKVITAGTYASQAAKVGDVFTSTGSAWVLIPAGDDIEDTWRNIKVNSTQLLGNGITTGAVNFKNGSNVTITGSGNDITISASYTDTNQKIKVGTTTFGDNAVVDITAGSNITVTGSGTTITLGVASGYSIPSDTAQTSWSNKYAKPSGGIPYTDMKDVGFITITSSEESGTLTQAQIMEATKKYCIIKFTSSSNLEEYYYKSDIHSSTNTAKFYNINTMEYSSDYYTLSSKYLDIDMQGRNYQRFSDTLQVRPLNKLDALIRERYYKPSTGIPSSDLATSGATSGSYGDSSNQTPAYGATFKVPYITVNDKGLITAISAHTVQIPASDNILPAQTTANKILLSTTTSGTVAWSSWNTAGLLKTNTSGQISVDTTAYTTANDFITDAEIDAICV